MTADFYHEGNRELQERFDTGRLAEALGNAVKHKITSANKEFIERMDMFFLATVDESGQVNCSYKGGEPGFVRVVDEHTIAFPNYDGNGMYVSMGNVVQTKQVGMLFIDFENQWRMRLNGEATVQFDDPLLAEYPEAQFIVRVAARDIFANCPRYIHKMKLVERSKFVPKEECKTPVPTWKKGAGDLLPADDPARDPDAEFAD